jgi:segregation and condensation protein A
MEIKVKLDNFEGPLDLLIHLIENRKMDPTKLVISKLIDDYLNFLEEVNKENLEIKIEFLVMASELLEIKALSILNIGEKEKKEKELSQKIKEYKLFRELSQEIEKLDKNLKKYKKIDVNTVFGGAENRLHLVYLFLAILEMYRNNLIEIDEKIIRLREDF